jgi:hypothetical protein
VYIFDSPDYDLLPPALGVSAVEVRVGFELGLAGPIFSFLARLGPRWGSGVARLLGATGGALGFMGHSGGAIMAELFWADGEKRAAALSSPANGQRLAALPCALAAARLAERRGGDPSGVLTPYQLFGVHPFLADLQAAGFTLRMSP